MLYGKIEREREELKAEADSAEVAPAEPPEATADVDFEQLAEWGASSPASAAWAQCPLPPSRSAASPLARLASVRQCVTSGTAVRGLARGATSTRSCPTSGIPNRTRGRAAWDLHRGHRDAELTRRLGPIKGPGVGHSESDPGPSGPGASQRPRVVELKAERPAGSLTEATGTPSSETPAGAEHVNAGGC